MANRLVNPFTFIGTFENFWSKASEILCAGSVEIMSTFSRTCDSCIAKLQLQKNHNSDYQIVQ